MQTNKENKDRFINILKNHPNQYYSYQYEPVGRFSVNGRFTHLDTDTQLVKMYKNVLMETQHNTPRSLTVPPLIAPLQNTEQWQDNNKYEEMLEQKFNINPKNMMTGYSLINKPDKILEAQSLPDNFYLNLLDCSKETSILAVALSKGIYLWRPHSSSITRVRQLSNFVDQDGAAANSIKWNPYSPNTIACGTRDGSVEIWDIQQNTWVEMFNAHEGRTGVLAWGPNCLISGGKDSKIMIFDIRVGKKVGKYHFHSQQICSLGVNSSEQFVASGSNDRNVAVWSLKRPNKRNKISSKIFKHEAAIKGIAWHPSKHNILATGGGTEDRSIRIINTSTQQIVTNTDTGSQVCNIMYSDNGNNLVSSHGFNRFQTNIWSLNQNQLKKQYSYLGHSKRVLYLTMNKHSQQIITGAGDQTIRFWKSPLEESSIPKKDNQNIMSLR